MHICKMAMPVQNNGHTKTPFLRKKKKKQGYNFL